MRHFSSKLHENSENEVMVLFGGTSNWHKPHWFWAMGHIQTQLEN